MGWVYDNGRSECKYCIPRSYRDIIVDKALAFMKPDPHAVDLGNGLMGYRVHSLYLDTPDLGDFWDRLHEHKVRNRLRIRTYGDGPDPSQPVFLENKRKLNCWVIKSRVRVSNSHAWCSCEDPRPWRVFAPGQKAGKRYAAEHFLRLVETLEHRDPVSVVHYEREVFVARDPLYPKLRLTLDYDVTGSIRPDGRDLYARSDVDLIPRDWMVMELKYDGDRQAWMRTICRELGLRAHPVSKFGLSVAKGVAGNHYREVRYLTPQPVRRLLFGSPNLAGGSP